MLKIACTMVVVVGCLTDAMAGGRTMRSIYGGFVPSADEPAVPQAAAQIPMTEALPWVRMSSNPADGDTFLFTNYDLGWNSPTNTYVVSYSATALPGTRAHFCVMSRPVGVSSSRAQWYVYYDGSSYNGAPVRDPSLLPTNGFGSLDVFRGGVANGLTVATAHANSGVGINGSESDLTFFWTELPMQPPRQLDPRPVIDSLNQIVYVVTTGRDRTVNPADIWLWKSTDYGTSFTFVDSLRSQLPYGNFINDLDRQIQVTRNGDIYLWTSCNGIGGAGAGLALPPLGTGNDSTVNKLGYLKSTDGGVSWSYTRIYTEGTNIIPSEPNDYYVSLSNGFSFGNGLTKYDALVDDSGVMHVVMNGQSIDYADTNDVHLVFGVVYWNSTSGTWKQISREADRRNRANDSLLTTSGVLARQYCRGLVGGPVGRSHTTIGYLPGTSILFAAWTEPSIYGTVEDTLNSKWIGQVWYSYSGDGGSSWSTPTQLTTSTNAGKYWVSVGRELTYAGASTSTVRAHIVYLEDQDNRNGVSVQTATNGGDVGANTNLMKPWIYHTVDFTVTSADERPLPRAYQLQQNFPNPFNPSTRIRYTIPNNVFVTLKVYNVLGQEVKTLVNETQHPGSYEVTFEATQLPAGVYFYKLSAGTFMSTQKMVMMK